MTRFLLLGLGLLASAGSMAQNSTVQSLINQVNIDSMLIWCADISGENPVTVNGTEVTIASRHSNQPGNEQAFQYLKNKLLSYGLEVDSQLFSGNGKNLIARQPGVEHPGQRWVLTGHYDAIGGPTVAPAADDDGSGTVAVVEAARLLSQQTFAYTIEYVIFDMEEQGLVGSEFMASSSGGTGDTLLGVLNMDAIAWDGDGDDLARIHTRPIGESIALADSIVAIHDRYNIGLNMVVNNPGATYSDHASFWNQNFTAVLVIEDFDNDGNPYYHTEDDRVQYFDTVYFHKLAKLCIGSIASLAEPMPNSIEDGTKSTFSDIILKPNPTNNDAIIEGKNPINELIVFNSMGQVVWHQKTEQSGALRIPSSGFAPGTYHVRTRSGNSNSAPWDAPRKLIVY